ncbi:MAG: type II toxin-antitoxin system PemK/MazF family toxin [bacterium]
MKTKKPPERGELWWIQFPGEDKQRPAVIVSPNVRNREGENVIVAGCTTKRVDQIYDDEVKLDGIDLDQQTKVQCDYLYTIKQSLLMNKESELLAYHLEQLDEALTVALGMQK